MHEILFVSMVGGYVLAGLALLGFSTSTPKARLIPIKVRSRRG